MSNRYAEGQNTAGTNPCEQDKDILLPYKKDLKSQKITWRGAASAARITKDTVISSRNNKVCSLLKAEETTRLYRNIDFYVAIDANCKAEVIEKNIDDLIKKSADLEAAIKEVVKSIKNIKDKAVELKAKACELDTQRNDSCNNQQLNILNIHFGNVCPVDKPGENRKFEHFSAIVNHLITQTGTVYRGADKAFSAAVSIAGIQTFSNIKSLKETSKQVTLCIKDFKKDIDSNIKTSADELKNAQDELAKAVKEVSLKTLDEHKESVRYEGVAFTMDFLCNPDCQEGDITDLCCKVMETFCNDTNSGQEEAEGKPQYSWQNAD